MLPGLEGVAPAVASGEGADPSTMAAVEVEVVRRGVHDPESGLRYGRDVGGGDPHPAQRTRETEIHYKGEEDDTDMTMVSLASVTGLSRTISARSKVSHGLERQGRRTHPPRRPRSSQQTAGRRG